MKALIKEVKIIDPQGEFHNQIVDLQVANGIIEKIATNINLIDDYQLVAIKNLHVSKGWFDTSVSFGEPGFEDRETIQNGLAVAAQSGFAAVALQPNSYPIIDNQSYVRFVKQKAEGAATELFPVGALTKNSDGTDLAELFDMKKAGAIAFGDYNKAVSNPNLLKIALQYVHDFEGLIIAFSEDEALKSTGVVNEGVVATQLGLKGIPNLAEEIQVARNLALLEYTGGTLHIPTISTATSAALIKAAKIKGLKVSCSVAVHNLVLSDENLIQFDTRFKVSPPLRTRADCNALLAAVLDNTIDCITADHNPIDIEHKKIEFDLAKNGTIGLESAFGALLNLLPLHVVVDKLTNGRHVFNLEISQIKQGSKACLSFFTADDHWEFKENCIKSKSKNSAFLNLKMTGKPVGIYNQSQLILTK